MTFNTLADLLQVERGQSIVSFSAAEKMSWPAFIDDIATLIKPIQITDCHSVAICCEDSYLFSVAFFAAIYAGKKVVLPGNHQPAMLLSLSTEFDLLIDDGLVDQIVKKNASITLPIDRDCEASFDFFKLDLNKVKITLFTSGSTGTPKAINKNLLMLDAEINALENQFGHLLSQTSIVSTVSHQHIYGLLFRVLWPLCAGRPFASKDLIYPEQVIVNGIQSQTLISSPALLKRLENEGKKGNYRAVFSSGGPLSHEASSACKALLNNTAIEVFGSTETGGIGFRQQQDVDSPWTFFPEITVQLGAENCLALNSPWLSDDLSPIINKTQIAGGFYQTSDQCELLAHHQFQLRGRIDHIVKIEEKRISLVEVETHINELKWVSECAVIVVTEPHRDTLGALLTLSEEGKQTLAISGKGRFWIQLRQSLRKWVEPVGIPRHFRITEEIPMNKQGKRLVKEITELFR